MNAPCLAWLAIVVASPILADEFPTTLVHPEKFDISPTLSEIQPIVRKFRGPSVFVHRVRPLPGLGDFRGVGDAVVQTKADEKAAFADAVGFEGLGDGLVLPDNTTFVVQSMPPDIAGAAGTTQYVQWVNTSFAVFDKSGALKYGPADGRTLWAGFGGPCEKLNDGDPVVLFDRMAGRWVMTQFAVSEEPFCECIAVSTTASATGTYARYQYNFDDYNDYPKFGVWPDGYYATYNIFNGPTRETPAGAEVCSYDRASMLAAKTADAQCVKLPSSASNGGLLPSDMEGAPALPVTPPNYVLGLSKSRLKLWRFSVNWASPGLSRFRGPVNIDVEPFVPACLHGPCVPEPPPGNPLAALGDRLMFRNSFRRMGLVDSLVVAHSVFVSGTGGGPNSTGVRWYEVRDPQTTPTVAQQSTYAPDAASRWLPSAAMDKAGNIAVGYNLSSLTRGPSIFLAGRSAGDPPSLLSAETAIRLGQGSQSFEEWGDYSTMTVDPIDDCTFWFTGEYLVEPNADRRWHTYIVHTRFNSCH